MTAVEPKSEELPRGLTMKNAILGVLFLLVVVPAAHPQDASPSGAVWNQLLQPAMDPAHSAAVENVDIQRDRIRIRLVSGTIQFAQPANGMRFAAVFHGQGAVEVEPPNPIEVQQLMLFLKAPVLKLAFTDATFSFTDGLYEEIEKQVKWKSGGPAADDLYANRQQKREDQGLSAMPRMFQGVLSEDKKRTAYFLADLKIQGKDWVEFSDDALEPEEIRVGRWVDVGPVSIFDTWTSFPAGNVTPAKAWENPLAKDDFLVREYTINTEVTSGAELHATAKAALTPQLPGQRVLVFGLDSNLRVESVKDEQGRGITFFQARERGERYQSYGSYVAVVLNEPLAPGKETSLEFRYGGKRAIRKVGGGNFYCESSGWYPSVSNAFATRSSFNLTFHSPKHTALVATGDKVSDTEDGNGHLTSWKSQVPLSVAGFAYGDYKVYDDKAGDVNVTVYANREPDEVMQQVQLFFEMNPGAAAVGTLTPSAMAKTMGMEMSNTIRVFSNYFSPYPYKTLAVTSLPLAYSYGQGWPGLIYLWSASFLDSTQRHAIKLKDGPELTDFFRGHESSHQWWGHKVGWKSYHDQWLSEGFAEFSGNLYVQYRDGMKDYLLRWRQEKDLLKRKDINGHEVESLGPIWMGQRIHSSMTDPMSYQDLIYSKGGYLLHMLRMQLWDSKNPDPDHAFKAMMWDYCAMFDNKAASTEDFKAIVEKHMTRGMDLAGNHKMDWFFQQYVYGTGMPQYTLHVALTPTPDGKTSVTGTLERSGVAADWKDAIPMYIHAEGKVTRVGMISARSATEKLDFVLPMKVDKLTINDNEDLLADVKQ